MEFKKAKQILNKNRDKKLTDEEIVEIMKIMEVFVKLAVNDLLKSRNVPTMEFGLTRHGIAGVTTVYFFDPSGNRNEFQCGAYETPGVPDRVELVTWDADSLNNKAVFYYEAAAEPKFFQTVS
jgi:hypothetical protein